MHVPLSDDTEIEMLLELSRKSYYRDHIQMCKYAVIVDVVLAR